jgi:hypothetical protein
VIYQISLSDCLEPSVPPEQVLTVSAMDDAAFVRICKVDQGSATETHTEVAEISVSLPALLEAVGLLARDVEREHLRPVDHDGRGNETRLAGDRLIVAGTGPGSAVGARSRHQRYSPPPKPPRDATEKADDL